MNGTDGTQASAIRYLVVGGDNYPLYYRSDTGTWGIYKDMLDELEAATGMTAVNASSSGASDAAEALEALSNGEADLVFGLPSGIAGGMSGVQSTSVVYKDTLTALINIKSPQIAAVDIENCYWGIESVYAGMTEGTAFTGHTVDFNSVEGGLKALEKGDIYGMFVRRSSLEYDLRIRQSCEFGECAVAQIPYEECIYLNTGNEALNACVLELVEELGVCGADPVEANAVYTGLLAEEYSLNASLSTAVWVGGTILFVLSVVAVWLVCRLRKQRGEAQQVMETVYDSEPEKELWEYDIHRGTLCGYKDFALLGMKPGDLPDKVTLEELKVITGYDFPAHFSEVTATGSTIYHNRIALYLNGRKYRLAEDGRRVSGTLYITVTSLD